VQKLIRRPAHIRQPDHQDDRGVEHDHQANLASPRWQLPSAAVVLMGDRIVVMEKDPGHVIAEVRVPLAHPRLKKSNDC
jgi:hypothetical protein